MDITAKYLPGGPWYLSTAVQQVVPTFSSAIAYFDSATVRKICQLIWFRLSVITLVLTYNRKDKEVPSTIQYDNGDELWQSEFY